MARFATLVRMTLPPQHYGARLRLGGGTKGMVLWVHLLRAAAALAVMIAHANQSAHRNRNR